MRARLITTLSLLWGMLFLAGCGYFCAVSGVQYHEEYSLAMGDDEASAELTRISIEEANVLSAIGVNGCLFVCFLLWWLSCLPVAVLRMKRAAVSRPALRYIASFIPYFVALRVVAYALENGRSIYGDYDASLCLLTLTAVVLIIGSFGSMMMIYFCCHLPWKKALIRKSAELS